MSTAQSDVTFVVALGLAEPKTATPFVQSLAGQAPGRCKLVIVSAEPDAVRRWLDGLAPNNVAKIVEVAKDATLAESLSAGLKHSNTEAVAFARPSDRLAPSAVAALTAAFGAGADVAYTNVSRDGAVVPKPVYSPERLRGQNYMDGLIALRRTLVEEVGGIRHDRPGAELYDLLLRATTAAGSVHRIESVELSQSAQTLHDHGNPIDWVQSITASLRDHLVATGGGMVNSVSESGVFDTRRPVTGNPLVSIIIPTRGDHATVHGVDRCLVVESVRSVLARTTYTNLEFVIVIDEVARPDVRAQLEDLGASIRFIEWSRPFSFSAKMNLGALRANGEFLLLLNDDTEMIAPRSIEAMLSLAQRPNAGVVGAMLYFEDDTIQHAGHAYYHLDVTHIGLNSERGSAGPEGAFQVEREVDGATAACAIVRRSVFLGVGGFSDLLPGNFNDVDLCMKLTVTGYQSYITPHAEFYHFESKTRDPRVSLYEVETAWGRWEHLLWDSRFWPLDPHTLYVREQTG